MACCIGIHSAESFLLIALTSKGITMTFLDKFCPKIIVSILSLAMKKNALILKSLESVKVCVRSKFSDFEN